MPRQGAPRTPQGPPTGRPKLVSLIQLRCDIFGQGPSLPRYKLLPAGVTQSVVLEKRRNPASYLRLFIFFIILLFFFVKSRVVVCTIALFWNFGAIGIPSPLVGASIQTRRLDRWIGLRRVSLVPAAAAPKSAFASHLGVCPYPSVERIEVVF